MFCSQCGKNLKDGVKFCPNCGSPIRQKAQAPKPAPIKHAAAPAAAVVNGAKKPPVRKKTIFLIAGICGAAAVVLILTVALLGGGKLGLGQTQMLASENVPASGGVITVSGTGTVLDGMELSVPGGAYAQDTPFTISATEITSNGLGDLFNPVTPLISVENGGEFADEPMTVTIPIQKTDSEFAMAFGYDRATGELEGIPFAELANDHITIVTAHFSDVVVSTVDIARISGEPDSSFIIDSGFRPGVDDFQMPNMSDANNYGHCSGQCIAELYYYGKKSLGLIGWDQKLNGRFDNNGRGDTADLYWDDAQAIRLCAAEHKLFNERWTGYVNTNDKDTYYAFAYAIAQTHQPQLCIIRSTAGGGHAIIVYAVKGDALLVADPNFPGKTDRYIGYQDNNLKSYFSGANSQEAGTRSTEYDMFGYYGSWKLVNKEVAAGPWQTLFEGQDPAAGYFPQDIPFQAIVGIDEGGSPVYAPLTDGMTVYAQDLAAVSEGMALVVSPQDFTPTVQAGDTFTFYNGTTEVDSVVMTNPNIVLNGSIPLKSGDNDIGILVMRQKTITRNGQTITYNGFLNFYRFHVTLAGGMPTASAAPAAAASMVVTPEETTAAAGQDVQFAAMAEGLPANPAFIWDFGDDFPSQTTDPTASHAYSDPGTYYGVVFLVDASDPTVALAQADFVVTVFLPESSEYGQPTESTAPAEWTVLLENSGGISEALYVPVPEYTPADVGVTRSVSLNGGGRLRVTADFASSMASGPRFSGDEFGYRAEAMVYIRYNGGTDTVKLLFSNGYDNDFDEIVQEVDIPSGQTVNIQIVPQGMNYYTDTKVPASDGDGYYYAPGQYKLRVEFLPAAQ